jgi:ATP-dependent Clp protease protease subunit
MLKQFFTDPNVKHEPLHTQPTIIRVTEFTEKSYGDFLTSFQQCVDAEQAIIPISIDSYGGQVYSLLGMLELIKTSPVPVATYVSSKAMSCGAVLLSAGTPGYRFMAPTAHVLIHQVSGFAFGKVEDVEVSASHMTDLNKQLMGMLSKNCGHDAGYFSRELLKNGNADLYYSPKESVKHGIVQHVKTPVFQVKVSVSYALG